jgi:gamma-glutamyltranspeptidase/glutathione hydrolase
MSRSVAAAGFYQGRPAAALVAAAKPAAASSRRRILDAYQVRELPPLECDYRACRIVSAPPPSSGGGHALRDPERARGISAGEYGWGSARAVHFEIEAMRHGYVDRNNLLGDPAFVRNPSPSFWTRTTAKAIRARIDPRRAGDSNQLRPGLAPREGTHTTHYSIAGWRG